MPRDVWSLDEYAVVADLYLRRHRSSGVNDPEVVELAQLTGRSAAAISRRLGNYDGTDRPGMGLKPVTGAAYDLFRRMQADVAFRDRAVGEARGRLLETAQSLPSPPARPRARLVAPEAFEASDVRFETVAAVRRMMRAEADLVGYYRSWLDPEGERLRSFVIPVAGRTLRTDLFDTALNLVIEAKGSVTREAIRYAIGQLIDYSRYLEPRPHRAILLPRRPSGDLAAMPREVGIELIWRTPNGFSDSVGGRYSLPGQAE